MQSLPTNNQYLHPNQQTSRSEEHTSELQSQSNLVCRLLLEKKKNDRQKLTLLLHFSSSRSSVPRTTGVTALTPLHWALDLRSGDGAIPRVNLQSMFRPLARR